MAMALKSRYSGLKTIICGITVLLSTDFCKFAPETVAAFAALKRI